MENLNLEELLFSYMDKVKVLISPELWSNALLDCSKNELFVLLFVYQQKEVNMTQIAEYIRVPLNTATGIAARLEKRGLLVRQRSEEDKRVVTVGITKEGTGYISDVLKEVLYYGQKVIEFLSPEEIRQLIRLADKTISALETAWKDKQLAEQRKEKKIRKILIE